MGVRDVMVGNYPPPGAACLRGSPRSLPLVHAVVSRWAHAYRPRPDRLHRDRRRRGRGGPLGEHAALRLVRHRAAVRPRPRRPPRRPVPRPGAVLAALQHPRARARRGPEPAAARAGPVPGDLRLQPRRVLHGPGGRPEAPDRRRGGRPRRVRPAAARGARADLEYDGTAARPRCSATTSSRRWPRRTSSCSAGPSCRARSRSR